MDEPANTSEPKSINQQTYSTLAKKEKNQKKETGDSVEPPKKFNTKFQGPHLKIFPDRELNQGLMGGVSTPDKSPSSASETSKQLLSLLTPVRNPSTPKLLLDRKVPGLSTKPSFHLPPLDPAVEVICRDWRANSPAQSGKENNLALAWEARSRRIKQTQDARKEFLFNGPGGMAGKMTKAADNKHKAQDV